MSLRRGLFLCYAVVALFHMACPATGVGGDTFPLGYRGEIGDWLVLGDLPLPEADGLSAKEAVGKGFLVDPLVEHGGESCLAGTGGAEIAIGGTNYVWRMASTKKAVLPICLDAGGDPIEKAITYLFCIVEAPRDFTVKLLLGSDDAVRVFLNGANLYEWSGQRSAHVDNDEVMLPLNKGENHLLVRIDNYVGNGAIAARLVTAEDQPARMLSLRIPAADRAAKIPGAQEPSWAEIVAQIPPVAPAPNEALFGARLTRTMSLLATSHITGRPVRILFYGQSIVCQAWTEYIMTRLHERFPEAIIIDSKPAIGGYTVPALAKTIRHDVYREQPDLVVFHAYAGNDGTRERLVSNLRRETTADILLFTHHVNARTEEGYPSGHEASAANIRRLAQKYNCELAEVREEWKAYLDAHPEFTVADFLRDSIHLNRAGCVLMAVLVERHFRTTSLFPSCWADRVRRYDTLRVREDARDDEIVFDGEGWQWNRTGAASSSTNDVLRLRFTGNRVDLVLPPGSGSARVLIDGRPPSAHYLYHATRPRPASKGASHLSSLARVFLGEERVPETWTLTFTELELDDAGQRVTHFRYGVEGSVTGPDGEGTKESEFVSNSGRIRIHPKDFFLSPHYAKAALKPGLRLRWRVVPDFLDVVPGGVEKPHRYVTVADGLPNGEHELTLVPAGESTFRIDAVEIHRPPLGGEKEQE